MLQSVSCRNPLHITKNGCPPGILLQKGSKFPGRTAAYFFAWQTLFRRISGVQLLQIVQVLFRHQLVVFFRIQQLVERVRHDLILIVILDIGQIRISLRIL